MSDCQNNVPFISAIKVKGIHLLPPAITQKRRVELQGYKQQAIKLEKRIKNCKDLKKNLQDLLNMQTLSERPYSEISFRGDSHIEALGITERTNDNHLPSKIKNVKLSQDIIDVTQYNNDGIKILHNDKKCAMPYQDYHLSSYNSTTNSNVNTSLNKSSQICFLLQPTDNENSNPDSSNLNSTTLGTGPLSNNSLETDFVKNISLPLEKSPRPRLIRSNSYTLETPSPILLAHLEKTEKSYKHNEVQNIEDIKHLSISRNWSSLEDNFRDNHMPFENSEFSSINTVYDATFNKKGEEAQSNTPHEEEQNKFERSCSPAIKVIQTDISVQNITVNARNEILDEALNENCDISDSQLLQLLKTLPDIYAKHIIELIESQKNKQKLKSRTEEPHENFNEVIDDQTSKKNYERTIGEHDMINNQHDDLNSSVANVNLKSDCPSNLHQSLSFSGSSDKLRGSTTSISPSQSVYYSITSSDTLRPLSNSSVRLIDFECDNTLISDENLESPKKTENVEYYAHEELKRRMNINRELFPQLDINATQTLKQEWAASVIGAHVRGYLTRRLLKTERVQSLIETIKDALMCALQLHNAENIDESDVELHRRLINQVSAACYTFHDIFFALTLQEQMLIIATDRQRKLEKAKRPSSAPSTRRSKSSARSTPTQQRVPSHSRSLTKV